MIRITVRLLVLCAVLEIIGPVLALPRPYLALFTFQQGDWNEVTDRQLALLQASPYDGIACWLRSAYDVREPPRFEELRTTSVRWRKITNKDIWPFVFINRIVQQEPGVWAHSSMSFDHGFAGIRALDLDDQAGALSTLLRSWQRALQLAKILHSPGVGLDLEFYNNYPLQNVATLARRRGEAIELTEGTLRSLGGRLADIVAVEYSEAVIWALFTGLTTGADFGSSRCVTSSGCICHGLLERAKQRGIPLRLIDGAEDVVGYQNHSLQELSVRLERQTNETRAWRQMYTQLELGVPIAPWLDMDHRAPWMNRPTVLREIEDFFPLFVLLLQQRPFVWVYGAANAYNVWQEPYASRFSAVLRQARDRSGRWESRP